MTFVNKDKMLEASHAAAEAELNGALEEERPEQLAEAAAEGSEAAEEPQAEDKSADGVLSDEEATWKDRYGNLRRYIDTKLKPAQKETTDELQQAVDALKSQVDTLTTAAAPSDMPETDADVAALKEENPAAYNALLRMASGIAETIVTDKMKGLQESVEGIRKGQEKNAEEAAFVELQRRHPRLNLLALSEAEDTAFNAWADTKSERFLEPLYNQKDNVDAASDVLDAYEQATGVNKKRKTRQAGADDVSVPNSPDLPKSSSGFEFSESQIANESDAWYAANAEAIGLADRAGKILMDVTDPIGAQRLKGARAA